MPDKTEILEISFKETKGILDEVFIDKYLGYTLVEAFPGIGLVGTIAANHIVDKLKMDQIGYIKSPKFPAVTSIHDYKPMHPARIYKSDSHKLIVLFSEFVIPLTAVYELAEEILRWSTLKGIDRIISLGGIVIKEGSEEKKIYAISTTDETKRILEKNKINVIKEGATTGVSGVLLAKCAIRKIDSFSLLVETQPEYIDPDAAALLLEKLQVILDIKIDTKELVEEAHKIEASMKETMQGTKKVHADYKKSDEAYGYMYG